MHPRRRTPRTPPTGRTRAIATTVVLLASLAAAGTATAAADPPGTAATPIDEVLVESDLAKLRELRETILEAEERFHERYNALNDNDEYDIVCEMEVPTGSRVPRRICWPRFVNTVTNEEAARQINFGGPGVNVRFQSAEMVLASRQPELRRRMRELVTRDPALRQALIERGEAEKAYKALQRKKFRNRRLVVE